MAFYKQDIVDVNLETGVIHRSFLNHTIGHKDDDADRFGIRAFRNGEPVDLSGAQCQAVFMAPDGTNIALTSYGTVSENVAYVTLPQACYNVEGQFCLAIKLVGGGVTATVRIIDGVVDRTGATGAVAPTEAVPTYQEILAVYAEMQEDIADYESVVATQNGKIDDLKSAYNANDSEVRKSTFVVPFASSSSSGIIEGGINSNGANNDLTTRGRTYYVRIITEKSYSLFLDSSEYIIINAFTYSGTTAGTMQRKLTVSDDGKRITFRAGTDENYIRVSFAHNDKSATMTAENRTAVQNAFVYKQFTDEALTKTGVPADAKAVGVFRDRYEDTEKALATDSNVILPFSVDGTGMVVYNTGAISSSTFQSHTNFIAVAGCERISYKRIGLTSSSSGSGIAFYSDADESAYISGVQCVNNQSSSGYLSELYTVPVPASAKYVRCSVIADTTTYGNFEIYGISKTAEDIGELIKDTFVETGYQYRTSQIFNNEQMSITDGKAYEGYTGRACTAWIGGTYIGDALKVNLPGYLYRLFYYMSASVSTYKGYTKAFRDNDIHIIPNGYMFRIAFYHDPVDSVEFTETEIANMASAITLYSSSKRAIQTISYHDNSLVYYAFGDSLVYGYDGDTHTRSANNYPAKIGKMLNMTVKNKAVVGQGLLKNWSDIHSDFIDDLDMSDANLITIGWAYNDFNYYASTNFGDYTDTDDTTFIGKYYTILKEFQQKCKTAQIILITGHGWGGGSSGPPVVKPTFTEQFTHVLTFADGTITQGEMYDKLEKMANLHGWPCVNQAKGCAINQFNCQTLIGDNIHPTNEGYVLYSNVIAARVAGYYANVK